MEEAEDLPSSPSGEGMRRAASEVLSYDRKTFSDLLGPLRRFLASQAGRPWDKVQSEISKHLPRRGNTVQAHIWQHIDHLVETRCVREGHLILDSKGEVIVDLHEGSFRRWFAAFYVAQDGILRKVPMSKKAKPAQEDDPKALKFHWLTRPKDGRAKAAVRWEGIWYQVDLADKPKVPSLDCIFSDIFFPFRFHASELNRSTSWEQARTPWGAVGMYAVSKTQMSKKGIRDLPKAA